MATSEEKTIFLYILRMVDKVKTKIIISFRKVHLSGMDFQPKGGWLSELLMRGKRNLSQIIRPRSE